MSGRVRSTLFCNDFYPEGFTICLSSNNQVYSIGKHEEGAHGQFEDIRIPTPIQSLQNIKVIDCGISHTICLDYEGQVYCFGSNNLGQFGKDTERNFFSSIPQKVEDLPTIKMISCG